MGEKRGVTGRLIAGAGGLALAASVFLTWYSLNLADIVRSAGGQLPGQLSGQLSDALGSVGGLTLTWSGWQAVHTIRFVLLLVGLGVLVSSLAPSTSAGNRKAVLVLAGGVIAAGLAGYRVESPPGTLDISVGPFQLPSPAGAGALLNHLLRVQAGAWVALLGSALVTLGGWAQLETRRTIAAETVQTYPIVPASKAPPASWS